MVVGGAVKLAEVKKLAEKWFGDIPRKELAVRNLPVEPEQTEARKESIHADVPLNAIYIAFHMSSRYDDAYYTADLISDILSRGHSSRLFCNLLKDQKLFSDINAYMTGSLDAGLFIVEGKPAPGVTLEAAEKAIWTELDRLKKELVAQDELIKVKNKVESTMVFSEMSLLDKAMNLAFFELLGDANLINTEIEKYLRVSPEDVKQEAQRIFRKENSSTLYYLAN